MAKCGAARGQQQDRNGSQLSEEWLETEKAQPGGLATWEA